MISNQIKMKRVNKMEMAKVNVIGKRGVQGEEDKEPERKDFMEFNLQKESVADVDDKSRVLRWGVWGGMGQLLSCDENWFLLGRNNKTCKTYFENKSLKKGCRKLGELSTDEPSVFAYTACKICGECKIVTSSSLE